MILFEVRNDFIWGTEKFLSLIVKGKNVPLRPVLIKINFVIHVKTLKYILGVFFVSIGYFFIKIWT